MSYQRKALWDAVKAWFEGGPEAGGAIDASAAVVHRFAPAGRATWKIYTPEVGSKARVPMAWSSLATPAVLAEDTFGYRWSGPPVSRQTSQDCARVLLTEYYRLVTNDVRKSEWIAVRPEEVPPESGLVRARFLRPREEPAEPYVIPDAPGSSWNKPGPAAGPFQSNLGDGSVVTYFWYRFADQPAQLNADLTDQERESLQARLEKLHRVWRKDREYLPAPRIGKLAELDPAVLVAPPAGLEVGYVPIVPRKEKRLK